jgi:hypothetical protein
MEAICRRKFVKESDACWPISGGTKVNFIEYKRFPHISLICKTFLHFSLPSAGYGTGSET